MPKRKQKNVQLLLPVDHVVADEVSTRMRSTKIGVEQPIPARSDGPRHWTGDGGALL